MPPCRVQRRADGNARQGKAVGVCRGTILGGTRTEIQDVYKRQQYMLQCGMPVPMHERSHAGLFGSIFIDIGDEQSRCV